MMSADRSNSWQPASHVKFSAPAAGMSQRDVTQRFPQLQGQEAELSRHILGFFTHHVQHKFPSKDCEPFTYGAIIDVHAKCLC